MQPWRLLLALALRGAATAAGLDLTSAVLNSAPRSETVVGEVFEFEARASTGFDVVNDRALLIRSGGTCGVDPPAFGSLAAVDEYAGHACGGAPTRLICGGVAVYEAGEYSVCVCDMDGPPDEFLNATRGPLPLSGCDVLERFSLEAPIGTISIEGVRYASLQLRSAAPGDLTFSGDSLDDLDRVRIVSGDVDCSDPAASKATHAAVQTAPSGQRSSGSAATSTWSGVSILDAGTYRVCWCSRNVGSCDSDDDFLVLAADLEVGGPFMDQQPQSCITGVQCAISVYGSVLSDEDRIAIIAEHKTCGEVGMSNEVLGGDGQRNSGDGGRSTWGVTLTTTGTFKICWCGSVTCATAAEFNILIGTVTSGGPNQNQVHFPPLGRVFDYEVTGWGLTRDDRIRFVPYTVWCGQEGAEVMADGVYASSSPSHRPNNWVGSDMQNLTSITWGDIRLSKNEQYRVCWCAGLSNNGCNDGADFALDLGFLLPQGPVTGQNFTAAPQQRFGLAVTAGPSTSFSVNDRIRIVSEALIGGTCGYFGSSVHSPAVCDQCDGVAHNGPPVLGQASDTALWSPVQLTEGGTFRICWCNDGYEGCDEDEDFIVSVGTLTVQGVDTDQAWNCQVQGECALSIAQTPGLAVGNKVQIVSSASGLLCGWVEQLEASLFSLGTRVAGTQSGGDLHFQLGSSTLPGFYRVCYCQDTGGCTEDIDFFQEAGFLTVSGVASPYAKFVCYLSGSCELYLQGTLLDEADALTLIAWNEQCGAAPVSGGGTNGFQGQGQTTSDGDLFLQGTHTSTNDNSVETWTFDLGEASLVGRYRLCYCSAASAASVCNSRVDYDQQAGELYVRGTTTTVSVNCNQGTTCNVNIVGTEVSMSDLILLTPSSRQCGESNSDYYPSWVTVVTPDTVDSHTNGNLIARYSLSAIYEAGDYLLCFCANITGAPPCLTGSGDPFHGNFLHSAGTVSVLGALAGVRVVTEASVGGEVIASELPATVSMVTVEVDAFLTGIKPRCVVTSQPAPAGFIPQMSDLMTCTKEAGVSLNAHQALFPKCWGVGLTSGQISSTGWNQVHVPVSVTTEDLLGDGGSFHVWCYAPETCSNDLCVLPADNVGLTVVPVLSQLSGGKTWMQMPNTPFALTIDLAAGYDVGQAWPRIKIIDQGGLCSQATLPSGVAGITCVESGMGKCEPAGEVVGSVPTKILKWGGLQVADTGAYQVCYCDRHSGDACVQWLDVGQLNVTGSGASGHQMYWGKPGEAFQVDIAGNGFSSSDRLRLVQQEEDCAAEIDPSTADYFDCRTPSCSTLMSSDASSQLWEVTVQQLGTYRVCWCSGDTESCTSAAHFGSWVGTATITHSQDCVATNWWKVTSCDVECGGGTEMWQRAVDTPAEGNGAPCGELLETRVCNTQACPLASVQSARTTPETVVAGLPFQVHIQGTWLHPDEDRVLIIGADDQCGTVATHFGGAACGRDGSNGYNAICGDGRISVRLTGTGHYRICVCDAGNWNGTSGNGFACSSASMYLLSPADGATFEVVAESAATTGGDEGGLPVTILVLVGTVTALLVLCIILECSCRAVSGCCSSLWGTPGDDVSKVNKEVADPAASMEAGDAYNMKAAPDAAADPELAQLVWYDQYYQSLGYPPGTSAQILGLQKAQAMMPALMDMSQLYAAQQQLQAAPAMQALPAPPLPPPLALPGIPSAETPPVPPPGGGRASTFGATSRPSTSPRNGKTFGDLIAEHEKMKPGVPFTAMDLSPMPTPTATPRGTTTPRETPGANAEAVGERLLALENGGWSRPTTGDGWSRPATGDARPWTGDSVLSDLSPPREPPAAPRVHDRARKHSRPDTADSFSSDGAASLAFSESSVGSNRPGTAEGAVEGAGERSGLTQSALKQLDAKTEAQRVLPLSTVKEEAEGGGDDKPNDANSDDDQSILPISPSPRSSLSAKGSGPSIPAPPPPPEGSVSRASSRANSKASVTPSDGVPKPPEPQLPSPPPAPVNDALEMLPVATAQPTALEPQDPLVDEAAEPALPTPPPPSSFEAPPPPEGPPPEVAVPTTPAPLPPEVSLEQLVEAVGTAASPLDAEEAEENAPLTPEHVDEAEQVEESKPLAQEATEGAEQEQAEEIEPVASEVADEAEQADASGQAVPEPPREAEEAEEAEETHPFAAEDIDEGLPPAPLPPPMLGHHAPSLAGLAASAAGAPGVGELPAPVPPPPAGKPPLGPGPLPGPPLSGGADDDDYDPFEDTTRSMQSLISTGSESGRRPKASLGSLAHSSQTAVATLGAMPHAAREKVARPKPKRAVVAPLQPHNFEMPLAAPPPPPPVPSSPQGRLGLPASPHGSLSR